MRWVVIIVVGLIGAFVLVAALPDRSAPMTYGSTPYGFPSKGIPHPRFPQTPAYVPPASTPAAPIKLGVLGIGLALLVFLRKDPIAATIGGILVVSGVGALGIPIINPSAGSTDTPAAVKYQLPPPPVQQFAPRYHPNRR